eukprot:gb/GECG01009342.1/.p1 GENE.gb/GECG01009342.1/~~gb/GECG01009342.1/.p1  ORF type:complete len:229 (+),score=40.50 gb/GECG01009342.1/:1-687(+)
MAAMERSYRRNRSAEASSSGETEERLKELTKEELKEQCKDAGIRPLPRTKADMIKALLHQEENAGTSAAYTPSSATTHGVQRGTDSLRKEGKRPRESDADSDNGSVIERGSLPKHAKGEIPPARYKLLEWLKEGPPPDPPEWFNWEKFTNHFIIEKPLMDFSDYPFEELEDTTDYFYRMLNSQKKTVTGEKEPLTNDEKRCAESLAKRAHAFVKKYREGVAGPSAAGK